MEDKMLERIARQLESVEARYEELSSIVIAFLQGLVKGIYIIPHS